MAAWRTFYKYTLTGYMAFKALCEFAGLAQSESLCVFAALRDDLCATASPRFDLTPRTASLFHSFCGSLCTWGFSELGRGGGWAKRAETLLGANLQENNPDKPLGLCYLAITREKEIFFKENEANAANQAEGLQFTPIFAEYTRNHRRFQPKPAIMAGDWLHEASDHSSNKSSARPGVCAGKGHDERSGNGFWQQRRGEVFKLSPTVCPYKAFTPNLTEEIITNITPDDTRKRPGNDPTSSEPEKPRGNSLRHKAGDQNNADQLNTAARGAFCSPRSLHIIFIHWMSVHAKSFSKFK